MSADPYQDILDQDPYEAILAEAGHPAFIDYTPPPPPTLESIDADRAARMSRYTRASSPSKPYRRETAPPMPDAGPNASGLEYWGEAGQDALTHAGDSASFGAGDELLGMLTQGVGVALGDNADVRDIAQQDTEQSWRDQQERASRRSPTASLIGDVAGTLYPGIGATKAIAPLLKEANLLQRTAASGSIGAIMAGLSGAGHSEGDRGRAATEAAPYGYAGGVAGELAGSAATNTLRAIGDTGPKLANALREKFFGSNDLANLARRYRTPPGQVPALMDELGVLNRWKPQSTASLAGRLGEVADIKDKQIGEILRLAEERGISINIDDLSAELKAKGDAYTRVPFENPDLVYREPVIDSFETKRDTLNDLAIRLPTSRPPPPTPQTPSGPMPPPPLPAGPRGLRASNALITDAPEPDAPIAGALRDTNAIVPPAPATPKRLRETNAIVTDAPEEGIDVTYHGEPQHLPPSPSAPPTLPHEADQYIDHNDVEMIDPGNLGVEFAPDMASRNLESLDIVPRSEPGTSIVPRTLYDQEAPNVSVEYPPYATPEEVWSYKKLLERRGGFRGTAAEPATGDRTEAHAEAADVPRQAIYDALREQEPGLAPGFETAAHKYGLATNLGQAIGDKRLAGGALPGLGGMLIGGGLGYRRGNQRDPWLSTTAGALLGMGAGYGANALGRTYGRDLSANLASRVGEGASKMAPLAGDIARTLGFSAAQHPPPVGTSAYDESHGHELPGAVSEALAARPDAFGPYSERLQQAAGNPQKLSVELEKLQREDPAFMQALVRVVGSGKEPREKR